MGHRVRVIDGKGPVSLPNKTVLEDGEETVLTDAEFARLGAAVGTLVTDLGEEDAPSQLVSEAELDAAIAGIPTPDLSSKQDAATAATDTELAAEASARTAADALKQDASTAATDAELASGLAAKQDASTAATDAELATEAASRAALPFQAGAGARSAKLANATAASGADSVAEGTGTTASGSGSHAEGINSTASGLYSHAEGQSTTASGQGSHAQGNGGVANGLYSHVSGTSAGASRRNQFSHAAGANSVQGDMQQSLFSLWTITSDATPTTLAGLNSVSYSGTSATVLTLPTNVAYAFELLVVAKRTGAFNETAMWKITGLIVRTNNGTVRIVGTNTVDARSDAAASAWTCVAQADDTNKALQVLVTGEAAKNINWHARLVTSEVAG